LSAWRARDAPSPTELPVMNHTRGVVAAIVIEMKTFFQLVLRLNKLLAYSLRQLDACSIYLYLQWC
jgi:hypothetical protein